MPKRANAGACVTRILLGCAAAVIVAPILLLRGLLCALRLRWCCGCWRRRGSRRGRGGRCAAAEARHRRAYGEDREHRVYAGRQAARVGLRRQDHPACGIRPRPRPCARSGARARRRCGQVYAMALSPDGKWLAAGGWMDKSTASRCCGDIRLYEFGERQARGAVEGACECGLGRRLLAGRQQAGFGSGRLECFRHPLGHRDTSWRPRGGAEAAAPARRA